MPSRRSLTRSTSRRSSPAGDNVNDATTYVLVCFAAETLILTDRGQKPVGDLRVGERVWVQGRGFEPLRWVGSRQVLGKGRHAPIVFAPGAIGNQRKLRVSPQHRMYVSGPQVELLFGTPSALVAAQHLVGKAGVSQEDCEDITYVHVMFDRHSVIAAEGALAESYFPGDYSLQGQDAATRAELLDLFPDLAGLRRSYRETCHVCLDRKEAKLLDLRICTAPAKARELEDA